jgi:tetratricopeptide (TPR) repeat protein
VNPAMVQELESARRLIFSGDHAEGLAAYARLSVAFPELGPEYGRAAAHCGDFELADRIWECIRAREPRNAANLIWLVGEYAKLGLHAKSRALLLQAASIEPRNLDILTRLAWLLSRTDAVEEARAVANKCFALDARNQIAIYVSAHLDRRENKLEAAERRLRGILAAGVTKPTVRYACHAELAQILERTQRFDEAMVELEKAKNDLRQSLAAQHGRRPFFERRTKEIESARALPKNILQTWAKAFPSEQRSAAPPLVFLTGSARSGTTLLERILDAHPAIAATDEVFAFLKINPFIEVQSQAISPETLNSCRARYVKSLGVALGAPTNDKTLLDKNPSHTFWLPAFLRVFPELRVLIALRDPRDILMSLYFQDQPYTNPLTLQELAQHYADVMDLWLAVREWEGFAWMETRYEDVVGGFEKEGRRVTEFLGLAWHENQARYFEKNREKPVLSTNYSDVTQPVYTRAVGRWRAFEKYLAPVLPMLEPYCKKFGYA